MGMIYLVTTPEEPYGIGVASMAASRALLFFEIAELLSDFLEVPHGLTDDSEQDEFRMDAEVFERLMEKFIANHWIGENVDYLLSWASYGAGMLMNATGKVRFWKIRGGPSLFPVRYITNNEDEFDERIDVERNRLYSNNLKARQEPYPEFNLLLIEDYRKLIENQIS